MKRTLWAGGILIFVLALGTAIYQVFQNRTAALQEEKISVSFTSYMTGLRGVKRIQLVELNAVEIIERTSEFSVFWNFLKLPDVVVQARIPVNYVFYVDLDEPVQMERVDDLLIVQAPPLRAGAPAADVSGMRYEVKKGSVFRSTQMAFEELRKTITPLLRESAEKNRRLVQEQARDQMAALVKSWMVQSKDLEQNIQRIEIRFANDPQPRP